MNILCTCYRSSEFRYVLSPLQIQLAAYDLGEPRRSSSGADVIVNIGRNKETPRFSESSYEVDLEETLSENSAVIGLRAQDGDVRVRVGVEKYSLGGIVRVGVCGEG